MAKLNNKPFTADMFTATKFDSAEEKAKRGNQVIDFIIAGMPASKWNGKIYHTIHQHLFSHIAHYNAGGFWSNWFSTAEQKLAFLQNALEANCYGMAEYTWSDVENAIKKWLIANQEVLEGYVKRATDETTANHMAMAHHAFTNLSPEQRQAVLDKL